MNSLQINVGARQTHSLSPQLQRAVQMLQMSSLDFAAMVRGKMEENPFLEDEADIEGGEHGTTTADEIADSTQDHAMDAELSPDREVWVADAYQGTASGAQSPDVSAMDLTASPTTLAMHLHGQLNVMPLPARDLAMCQAIVESLDDDGYLRTDLHELVEILPVAHAPDVEELAFALRLVQSLDPAGIAARSVGECLLLQCSGIDDARMAELARSMVSEHLPAVAKRDITGLSKRLGEAPLVVEKTIDRIKRMNPRPGWSYGSARVDYIVPDVIVRRDRKGWDVQLNPAVVPHVRLNKVYEKLFQRHKTKEHAQLIDHLQDAHWTVRNMEQRFATILGVAQAIVRKQRYFLEYGAMAMKPMILREIADEVGVHESTVSRVTSNKYMSTPLGVFELKHFFSRSLTSASGEACSPTAIREVIHDMIAAESPANPLSDGDIARQLESQGLKVARRTVTKYRQLLGLEAGDKRKRLS
ncbi:MAG: RNA polymerase factor sigma-54 [Comamonadaceae bacterium]|nr:RNA polymerase factor sigma-54 [Comamonadaceae bacterium]